MGRKQYLYLTTAFLAVFLFIMTAGPASSATYVVNSTTDAVDNSIGDGICATAGSVCTLRAAIQEANSDLGPEDNSTNDTITISAGIYLLSLIGASEDSAATGDLDITDTTGSLTLNGAGSSATVINGNSDVNSTDDRVFHTMSSTTVVFNDLTMTNGSLASSGIGLFSQGTTTLNHVIVSNNNGMSSFFGAGIRCQSGTMTITDSTITGNTSDADHMGAGLSSNSCNLTITGSTFSNNTSGDNGGALFIGMGASTTVLIEDITIANNSSTLGSGIRGSTATTPNNAIELRNVTISGNNATGVGGGIYTDTKMNLTNVTLFDNEGAAGGGIAVANDADADINIAHSTIIQNTADDFMSPAGGGIYVSGSSHDITITGSIIAANSAGSGSSHDCSASGIDSMNYSLLDITTGCTIVSETGNTNTGGSPYATVALADHGGVVQTAAVGADGVTIDTVPAANCDEADGDALTEDARGLTRPENTNCDMGAYEFDQTDPVVTPAAGTDTVQCVTGTWIDAGATATDNFSTGLTASVTSGSVNANVLGTYPILYTSTADVDGNTGTATRTVTVSDTASPTITITGSAAITHEAATTYSDAGATATDSCDSAITVITAGSIATTTLGAQTLTYSATDDSSNAATQKTRTVTVVDTTIPVITLVGEATATIANGASYTDAGATATDSFQGNLTANIVTTNPVNTSVAGTYTVTYNVSDASNNAATTVTRTVTVQAAPIDETEDSTTEESVEEGEPIVTTNGKYVIVTVDGIVVDRMKVNHGTSKPKYYALATKSLYQNYTSVILLTADKTHAKLTVMRLMDNNQLTKKTAVTFAVTERAPLSLDVNRQRDRITATVGKGSDQVESTYHLTKTGKLKLLP